MYRNCSSGNQKSADTREHLDQKERSYSLRERPDLGVVLQVVCLRVHHDGDDPRPGGLHPLDVAGGYVGGEVVALRQETVQTVGNPLRQNA